MRFSATMRLLFTGLVAAACSGAVHTATVYTGDIIQGKRVISQLDVTDLEPGKKHSFYFQGVQMPTGQHWYVPVVVAKGAKPGKRILFIGGVHGDELAPIDVVQRTMAELDPGKMSGTVIAVYNVSSAASEAISRFWPTTIRGGFKIDMNRVWPGNEDGTDTPTRQAGLLFNRLFKPNADFALDHHTGTTGFDLAAFNFANLNRPEVRAMAELFPIDQTKNDPGYTGTLENALNTAGIPTLTTEVGAARVFDRRIIPMFVEGSLNVLKLHKVIGGPMGRTSKDAGTFFGDAFHTVHATHGGYLELLVNLKDKVVPGQKLAIQRNAFGEVVREYKTEVGGEIAGLQRNALIEPGWKVAAVLYDSPDPKCDPDGCPVPAGDYVE